jgi:hypothetical protein
LPSLNRKRISLAAKIALTLDGWNWTDVSDLMIKESIGDDPASSNEVIVDQLGDDVFGIPPNLKTGLLTGLVGAAAGGVSLFLYFYLWKQNYYVSQDWQIFIALGVIAGFFLRFEQLFFRAVYHHKTETLQQAKESSEGLRIESGFGHKAEVKR